MLTKISKKTRNNKKNKKLENEVSELIQIHSRLESDPPYVIYQYYKFKNKSYSHHNHNV
jgi:hypothetical protein